MKKNNYNLGDINKTNNCNDLDDFILNTNSFTLFLNFQYLQTFYKIFENFFERSTYLKYYFKSTNTQKEEPKTQADKIIGINNISAIPINQTLYSDFKNLSLNDDDLSISFKERKTKLKLLLNIVDIK